MDNAMLGRDFGKSALTGAACWRSISRRHDSGVTIAKIYAKSEHSNYRHRGARNSFDIAQLGHVIDNGMPCVVLDVVDFGMTGMAFSEGRRL